MPKLIFRNDLIATGLFFVFSLYFYLSNTNVGQYSRPRDKRLAMPATEKWEKPPEPHALNPELLEETYEKNTANVKSKQKIVILLASLPRSGSTMMSELLRTKSNTVLFFEPDHRTEFTTCAPVANCMSDYIRSILTCSFSDQFEKWQKQKFLSFFHEKTEDCDGLRKKSCKRLIDIRALCLEANYTITKLIRVPLGFLEGLLSDHSIDAKIIHLIRDPRASLVSNKKMGWVSDPLLKCTKVYDDMLSYDYLHEKFPNQIMQVKYEKFCVDPMGITKSIFSFTYGDRELPKETISYLKEHTEVAEVGAMNTARKSDEYYQKWRWEMKERIFLLIESEKACQKCIEKLNYTMFNTIENVQNRQISLFS